MTYSTVYLNGDIKFPFRLGEILYLEGTPPAVLTIPPLHYAAHGKLRQRKQGGLTFLNPPWLICSLSRI
jgi:hypothetical protein